jgi:acyl-coenzyme A thioesterase PaaI-like protein
MSGEHGPMQSPGSALLRLWRRLRPLPFGPWLFARIFGWLVPYSGSVRPRIFVLEPGHAEVGIRDRRANRQHLGSVHAIALMNVAEQASGLALLTGLPKGVRGIVTHISMEYVRKARGPIRAVCHVSVPAVTTDIDFEVAADCLNRAGEVVARATVRWRLGPGR